MVKPISPDEVATQKVKNLPDNVIGAWNSMIARKFSSGSAIILLKDIKSELYAATGQTDLRDLGYLDIEEVYRAVGWSVEYDQPGYSESYDAYYVFKKKK
jgi:hypothetical protein